MLLLVVDWTIVIAFYMEFHSNKLGNCNVLYECKCKTYLSRPQVLSDNTSARRITLVTSARQNTL